MTMRTAKVIADRVIRTRGMPAATGIAATNKTDSFAARASFEARAAFLCETYPSAQGISLTDGA